MLLIFCITSTWYNLKNCLQFKKKHLQFLKLFEKLKKIYAGFSFIINSLRTAGTVKIENNDDVTIV